MKEIKPTTDAIWSQLHDDLWRFIRRRVSDDHVADDLLQEAFLKIHRGIDSLTRVDRLAAWVYRIARNVVHDYYRGIGNCEGALGEYDPVDEPEDPLAELRSQAGGWLSDFINQLPGRYQEAVRLAELDDQTAKEVADRLGLSVPAAKSRIRRGRLMLRERLDACCQFEIDRRGNVINYSPRTERTVCHDCGDGSETGCS